MDGTTAIGLGLVSWADNKVAAEQTASAREIERFREQNIGEPRKVRLDAASHRRRVGRVQRMWTTNQRPSTKPCF